MEQQKVAANKTEASHCEPSCHSSEHENGGGGEMKQQASNSCKCISLSPVDLQPCEHLGNMTMKASHQGALILSIKYLHLMLSNHMFKAEFHNPPKLVPSWEFPILVTGSIALIFHLPSLLTPNWSLNNILP